MSRPSPFGSSFAPLRIFILLVALIVTGSTWAQSPAGVVSAEGGVRSLSIDVPINKSDVIRSQSPFIEVAVGNPEVADVQVLGDRSLYIFARQFGSTSVTLSGENGNVIAVIDVNVTHDVANLRKLLYSVLPDQPIAVRAAHDGIVLSGSVSSSEAAANAMILAERFAPEAVVNLLQVRGSQQVLLAVRFVEMRRDTLKRIGLNTISNIGSGSFSLFGSVLNLIAQPASIAQFGIDITSGSLTFNSFLDLLEDKGAVRTLAEPNLIALSGDTADFLAGGEFPIPVSAEDGQIKIEFKKFGVGLSFTPTVLADELINLKMFMEVSEPDNNNGVELADVAIPGLVVRRATTTVELYNGQSFAIAGLLQESFADSVEQVPLLGDVPILGALLRSTEYQTGQSELVMIVTPYLAQPANPASLSTPDFRPPSERQLFLNGETELQQSASRGGFSGTYGYSTQ